MTQRQDLDGVHLVFRPPWGEEKAGMENELLSHGRMRCMKHGCQPQGIRLSNVYGKSVKPWLTEG